MEEIIESEISVYVSELQTNDGIKLCMVSHAGDIETVEDLLRAFCIDPKTAKKKNLVLYVVEADKKPFEFAVGDAVEKVGGDYTFVGEVRSAFTKKSGAHRYSVEDDRGVLHIYSAQNLKLLVPSVADDAK